ncbi:MAG: hypothetical protein IJW29_08095 [Clostridia bacterium]|nr:hypothetical protein [Clostridia bacterium]
MRSKTDEENIFCVAQDGSPHPPLRGPPSPLEKAFLNPRFQQSNVVLQTFLKSKKVLLKEGTTVASLREGGFLKSALLSIKYCIVKTLSQSKK